MLVCFRIVQPQSRTYVLVHSEQINSDNQSLTKDVSIVGGAPVEATHSLIVPVAKGTKKIWLGFKNAYNDNITTVSKIEIQFLSPEGHSAAEIPLSAVGCCYSTPDEIPELLREMVDHYSHYRKTAVAFSHKFVEKHSTTRLVRILANSNEKNTATSFSARESK